VIELKSAVAQSLVSRYMVDAFKRVPNYVKRIAAA
jgi:hypothetical protein